MHKVTLGHRWFVIFILMPLACGKSSSSDSHTGEASFGDGPLPGKLYGEFFENGQMPIRYYLREGKPFFEGDIFLTPGTFSDGINLTFDEQRAGLAARWESSRWPNGVVPYRIEPDLANHEEVVAAIDHWQEKTPIQFVEWTGQRDFVTFQNGPDLCWSSVGRVGGEQFITLESACDVGSIVHEIGHAMGLFHEQNRADRDNYIDILWENIDPQYRDQFRKHQGNAFEIGEFDVASVMHYRSDAFSLNGRPTIQPKSGDMIEHHVGLSEGDIAAIRALYGVAESQYASKEEQVLERILSAVAEAHPACKLTGEISRPTSASGNYAALLRTASTELIVEFSLELPSHSNALIVSSLIQFGMFDGCLV